MLLRPAVLRVNGFREVLKQGWLLVYCVVIHVLNGAQILNLPDWQGYRKVIRSEILERAFVFF